MEQPETSPPSPKPKPPRILDLSGTEYCRELADRIESHIQTSVIGTTAKKEIGYAVTVLRLLGDDDAT